MNGLLLLAQVEAFGGKIGSSEATSGGSQTGSPGNQDYKKIGGGGEEESLPLT